MSLPPTINNIISVTQRFAAAALLGANRRRLELDRKSSIMAMRWLVVLLVLFMAAYSARGLEFDSPNYLLAYAYVIANVLISLISVRWFEKTWFTYLLFIADIIFVSAVIYFSEGVNTDFYLIYFLSIFMSSVGRSISGAVPVAVISSILYGWLIFQKSGADIFTQPSFWIRIPFFFLIALFSSFWSSQVASEKRQKEEIELYSQRLRREVEAATEEILNSREKLKALREYNDNILASISSGVIVVDLNGVVTTFNLEAANIFKMVSGAVIGKTLDQFEKMGPVSELLQRTMETGRPIYRRELNVTDDNGGECVLGISTTILHSQTARTNGAIAVFADLSKTKSLEERVKHSEKLAILGEMAAVMAHEIRNPLNSIAGFSQLLQMKVKEADQLRQYVDIIVQESFRIDTLISDILDFAHQKKTAIGDIDFDALAGKVIAAKLDAAGSKGVRLESRIRPGLPAFQGDAVRIERVLLNLVNNAIDATGDGGLVKLAADGAERDSIPGIELTVADTGCGIAPENLEIIFKPFFTTKQTGTGLGLAIIQKIVEEHEGTMSVVSTQGKGTTFTLFFPISAAAPANGPGRAGLQANGK